MFWFALLALFFKLKRQALGKLGMGLAFLVLTVGLILSFTRAAWVSLVAAGGLGLLMVLGVQLRTLLLTGVLAAGMPIGVTYLSSYRE